MKRRKFFQRLTGALVALTTARLSANTSRDSSSRLVFALLASYPECIPTWERVRMSTLEEGDCFCLFEADGKPVAWQGMTGATLCVATGDPYQTKGIWTISADPVRTLHSDEIPTTPLTMELGCRCFVY